MCDIFHGSVPYMLLHFNGPDRKLQADSLKAAIIVLTVLIVSFWDSSKSSLPFDLACYSTNTPL